MEVVQECIHRGGAGERRYIEKQKPRVVNGDVAMEVGGGKREAWIVAVWMDGTR